MSHLSAVPDPSSRLISFTLPESISRPRHPDWPHEPSLCPRCDEPIEVADRIHKVGAGWMHSECARQAIAAMSPRNTWLVLAEHLSVRPSQFSARQIRVIVRALLDIVQLGDEASADTPDGEPS